MWMPAKVLSARPDRKALREPVARYAFFLLDTAELGRPRTGLHAHPGGDALINPNTGTLPIFRTAATLT